MKLIQAVNDRIYELDRACGGRYLGLQQDIDVEAFIKELQEDETRFKAILAKEERKRKMFLIAYWAIVILLAYRAIF